VSFDENAVTDAEVLCYYAYSDLYVGSVEPHEIDLQCRSCTEDEFVVNTQFDKAQRDASVAGTPGGGFVVAWEGLDASAEGIRAQQFDASGDKAGPEIAVITYTLAGQRRPEIAATATGEFLVVWDSWKQDGDTYGVYAQRFDVDGDPVDSELQLNSFTAGRQYFPRLASGADRIVVAWQSDDQDGSEKGSVARVLCE